MSVWVYKQLVTFPWQILWQYNCCASLTTVVFPSGVATFVVLTVLITSTQILAVSAKVPNSTEKNWLACETTKKSRFKVAS